MAFPHRHAILPQLKNPEVRPANNCHPYDLSVIHESAVLQPARSSQPSGPTNQPASNIQIQSYLTVLGQSHFR